MAQDQCSLCNTNNCNCYDANLSESQQSQFSQYVLEDDEVQDRIKRPIYRNLETYREHKAKLQSDAQYKEDNERAYEAKKACMNHLFVTNTSFHVNSDRMKHIYGAGWQPANCLENNEQFNMLLHFDTDQLRGVWDKRDPDQEQGYFGLSSLTSFLK